MRQVSRDVHEAPERVYPFSDTDFRRVRALIHRRAGIALGEQKREMAYSRLVRRLRALDATGFVDYLDALEANEGAPEWEHFVNALTTNLTSFFREPHHFPLLADFVRGRTAPVTVWCAAASTGEEPYSIAMTLVETLGDRVQAGAVYSTDIDTQVLQRARQAVYPLERVQSLSPERLRRFFLKGRGEREGLVRVRPELRDKVRFDVTNLLESQWPLREPVDAIFCRNVMIYFDKPTQAEILRRMAPLLKPGGLLFAGHSENFSYVSQDFRLRGKTVYERVRDRS